MMPHQDGWDVLQTLTNQAETQHIPIVVTSILDARELAVARLCGVHRADLAIPLLQAEPDAPAQQARLAALAAQSRRDHAARLNRLAGQLTSLRDNPDPAAQRRHFNGQRQE
jgi:CheY-like chemotaxis protein